MTSTKDNGYHLDLPEIAKYLISSKTEAKSSLSTSAENKPVTAPSPAQNKEIRSAAKLKELICTKVPMVNFDHKLYAYTGRSYQLLVNPKALLNIVENRVDRQIFDLSSFRVLECVFDAMAEDEALFQKTMRNVFGNPRSISLFLTVFLTWRHCRRKSSHLTGS